MSGRRGEGGDEEGVVGERLLDRQVLQVGGREGIVVAEGQRLAVVPVLDEDHGRGQGLGELEDAA